MLILIMGIAQTKALVLDLTRPPPRNDTNARIATDPLGQHGFSLTAPCIATEPAMLAGNGLGFHAMVRHHLSLSRGPPYRGCPPRSLCRCTAPRSARSLDHVVLTPRSPVGAATCLVQRAPDEPIVQSPTQPNAKWQHQSDAASPSHRYQRKQRSSVKHEQDRTATALQRSPGSACASFGEPEPGTHRPGPRGVVFLALHSFSRRSCAFTCSPKRPGGRRRRAPKVEPD